jgi:organic radical activating enzyme
MQKQYAINEIFYSLQGEGIRAGCPSIFVRFSGCNQRCTMETQGFNCDTNSAAGRLMIAEEVLKEIVNCEGSCKWLVLTGGEPTLQIDSDLFQCLRTAGYRMAIETNGTLPLQQSFDWVTVSPKTAEANIKQRRADEVKYVRNYGQPIPQTTVEASHKLISPAFNGSIIEPRVLEWCIELVKRNPDWQLSVQQHKVWHIK